MAVCRAKSEDLTVVGHTGDLFIDIYARNLTHIYFYRSAQRRRQGRSILLEQMLNLSGQGAQSGAEYSVYVKAARHYALAALQCKLDINYTGSNTVWRCN